MKIVSKEGSYDEERIPLMPVDVMESLPRFLCDIEDMKKKKRLRREEEEKRKEKE